MNAELPQKQPGYRIIILITAISTFLAVLLYLLLSFIMGTPIFPEIIKAVVIPIVLAPPLCYRILQMSSQLSLAEKALQESEIKFRSIVENSHDGIMIVDGRYRFLYVNAELCEIMGYPSNEILGQDFRKFLDEKGRSVVADHYRRRQKGEEVPAQYEFNVVRKSGDIRRVEIRSTVQQDSKKGALTYAQLLDITETRVAEKELQKSEKRYRDVFENTGTATVIIDKDKKISMANTKFTQLSGYSKKEIENKMRWTNFVSAEDLKEMKKYHAERRKRDGVAPTTYEFEFIDRFGNTRQILNKVNIISGSDESVASLLDITDIVKVKNDLEKSEKKFRLITASAKDAIIMIDDIGKVTYWNDAAKRIFGYTAREILGKELHRILAPSGVLPVYQSVSTEFQKTGHGAFVGKTLELTGLNKDRAKFPIELSVSAFKLNGEWNAIGIVRDISERKKLENELQQAHKMEAIGTLAGGVAHDFNNILGAIIGYAELAIIDAPDKSRLKSNLHGILKGANRAKDLVKQILAFSRQGKQKRKPIYIGLVIKEALKLLRASLPATIDIHQQLEPELGAIKADPTQLHQVLMNLCTNAASAMAATGGRLTVRLENRVTGAKRDHACPAPISEPHLKLTVSDTGHGIDPDVVERIFEPYFTTREGGEGTGLGLSVVHGIIKSHGGTIDVSSEPGKGATFKIRLPFTGLELQPEIETERSLPTGEEHVLVVDDEQDLIEIAKQMLTRLGYTVSTETSSTAALKLFKIHPDRYDLVLTDMTMPIMTGKDLAGEIKKIRPDLPIILCSGFNKQINKKVILEMGIDAFVMKPIVMHDMAHAVRQVLDKSRPLP